jgi:hypothetical protein
VVGGEAHSAIVGGVEEVAFESEELIVSSIGSRGRIFFEGVDEEARSSQRADRLEGGVVAEVGMVVAEVDLGK